MRAIQIVDALAWWVMSRRKRTDGLLIGVWDGDHDAELFDKVGKALALIATHDPLRYARLQRDLARIWVLLLPGNMGSFHADTSCCRLDCRIVLSASIERIASVIVHEATHARLTRAGIGYEESARTRVEAVCVRREAAFAARCPAGKTLQSDIEAERHFDASTWTADAFRKRHLRGTIEGLRYLGSPSWLVASALRLYRFRRWRRRGRSR